MLVSVCNLKIVTDAFYPFVRLLFLVRFILFLFHFIKLMVSVFLM